MAASTLQIWSLNVSLRHPTLSSFSASGKSHFGLQLCVAGQTPSGTDANPCGAILLTSERKVSFSRLEELARCINPSRIGKGSDKAYAKQLLDNVHTLHITEVDGLDHALAYIIPAMISRIGAADTHTGSLPIRLLVIDSIGALFRSSFETGYSGLTQRSKMLCLIADKLKLLAQQQSLAVVVINQVTDVFSQNTNTLLPPRIDSPPPAPLNVSNSASDDAYDVNIEDDVPPTTQDQPTMTYKRQSRYFSGQSQGYSKEASLGLVWANAVNVRIMLSRTGRRRLLDPDDLSRKKSRISPYERERQHEEGLSNEETFEPTLIRRMHLVFSPFARQDLLDYVILQSGIHSVLRLHRSNHNQNTGPNVQGMTSSSKQSKSNGQPFDEDMIFDDLSDLPPEFWQDDQNLPTTT